MNPFTKFKIYLLFYPNKNLFINYFFVTFIIFLLVGIRKPFSPNVAPFLKLKPVEYILKNMNLTSFVVFVFSPDDCNRCLQSMNQFVKKYSTLKKYPIIAILNSKYPQAKEKFKIMFEISLPIILDDGEVTKKFLEDKLQVRGKPIFVVVKNGNIEYYGVFGESKYNKATQKLMEEIS